MTRSGGDPITETPRSDGLRALVLNGTVKRSPGRHQTATVGGTR